MKLPLVSENLHAIEGDSRKNKESKQNRAYDFCNALFLNVYYF